MTEHPAASPLALFKSHFDRALAEEPFEANAMSLATIGQDGGPDVRIVLLKGVDERGLQFFTNYESDKGRQLEAHPVAACAFHWPKLAWQIRFRGAISRLDAAESDAYFATRPRGSQIGAWASAQSRPLSSRENLERAVLEVAAQFEGARVPRPPHWGGYLLVPNRVEFWYGAESRLHSRHAYERTTEGFTHALLSP